MYVIHVLYNKNNTIHIIYIFIVSCNIQLYILYIIRYLAKISVKTGTLGSLWFEHKYSSTQMRRLTNPALTRLHTCNEIYIYQRISDLNGCDHFNQISFKLITLNHSVNSLVYMHTLIPQRLERQTYSYQKHTLPIKLRNLWEPACYWPTTQTTRVMLKLLIRFSRGMPLLWDFR